jgi:hypothetical protein
MERELVSGMRFLGGKVEGDNGVTWEEEEVETGRRERGDGEEDTPLLLEKSTDSIRDLQRQK